MAKHTETWWHNITKLKKYFSFSAYIITLCTNIDRAGEVAKPYPALTLFIQIDGQMDRQNYLSVKPCKNFLDPSDYSV